MSSSPYSGVEFKRGIVHFFIGKADLRPACRGYLVLGSALA